MAFIPAFLFYLGVFVTVHLIAKKSYLGAVDTEIYQIGATRLLATYFANFGWYFWFGIWYC